MKNETTEKWVDIPKYEGYYIISDNGNIFRLPRYVKCKDGITRFVNGCKKMPYLTREGYLCIDLYKDGLRTKNTVHSLVFDSFNNEEKSDLKKVINHINFNKMDNRLKNLEIISHRENTSKSHIKSESKYVGVGRSGDKWRARIMNNGTSVYLGTFDTDVQAKDAYLLALFEIENDIF